MHHPNEDLVDKRYDTESSTPSASEEVEEIVEDKEEEKIYTPGKARRIIVRAKITHD